MIFINCYRMLSGVYKTRTGSDRIGLIKPGSDCIRLTKPRPDPKKIRSPYRGFIKGWALGKLTGCEQDLAINLPSCFHLLFLLPIIRKTKNALLKNPTDLLHKNLMKPLAINFHQN